MNIGIVDNSAVESGLDSLNNVLGVDNFNNMTSPFVDEIQQSITEASSLVDNYQDTFGKN